MMFGFVLESYGCQPRGDLLVCFSTHEKTRVGLRLASRLDHAPRRSSAPLPAGDRGSGFASAVLARRVRPGVWDRSAKGQAPVYGVPGS